MADFFKRLIKSIFVAVLGVIGFFVVLWGVIYFGTKISMSGSDQPDEARQEENARQNVIYYGQKVARNALKDPDSAKFHGLTVVKKDGSYALCGKVNSKNSFGGYTGNQLFLVVGKKAVFQHELKHNVFAGVWNQFCATKGAVDGK